MANRCQMCPGEPRIAVEDWRAIWLGDTFYLEWGKCCDNKQFETPVEFTNANTGEVRVLNTPREVWILIVGEGKADKWGDICLG